LNLETVLKQPLNKKLMASKISRRKFLEKSAIATAGLAIAPSSIVRGKNASWQSPTCSPDSSSCCSGWQSELVQITSDGSITYVADETGNVIPDFSHAGYGSGGVPLPTNIPVVKTISPIAGDNTEHIQAAIDAVSRIPLSDTGYRGALRLEAGVYTVSSPIHVSESGIVIIGAGQESDPAQNTVIRRIGTLRAPVIQIGKSVRGGSFATEIADTRTSVITPRVIVGAYSLDVENASQFCVGDAVVIVQPSTEAWLASVDFGGAFPERSRNNTVWRPGEIDIRYHRYIVAINRNTITFDAPVYDNLNRQLSQSYVAKFDDVNVTRNVGIEKIFVDIETAGGDSEEHARDCIVFRRVENCWARCVTTQHFFYAGILFSNGSTRSTAIDCRAVEPRGIRTGARFYNFCVQEAQLILFENCFANGGRHSYISNGCSLDSGIVFLNCVCDNATDTNEGHRRWPQALLFDNLHVINPASRTTFNRAIGLYNRGSWGTAHGWAAAHSVAWNCVVPEGARIVIQKPPGAQNYGIGGIGEITGQGPFEASAGYIEGANKPGLMPRSLYKAQLNLRIRGL
jgi:hypothetical protein